MAFKAFRKAIKYENTTELFVSASYRQSKYPLEIIKRIARHYKLKLIPDTQTEIGFENGSKIISLPQAPHTIRVYDADDVFIDEFAHFKQDREVFAAVQPITTRTDRKRTLTLISTPLGKQGEFHRLWETGDRYSRHHIDIYTAIKDGCPLSVDEIRNSGIDDMSFRQEYCCEFLDESTSFFPYELIKQCWDDELVNSPVFELAAKGGNYYAGYDPAKSVDSAVFIVIERTADNLIIVRHIREFRGVAYSEQLAYIQEFVQRIHATKLITDQTGVGGKIQEDLSGSLGGLAEGVTFTNAFKERIITDLRVLFQDKKISIPHSGDYPESMALTNQLHGLQRTVMPDSKLIKFSAASGEHDDYPMALAMACHPVIAQEETHIEIW